MDSKIQHNLTLFFAGGDAGEENFFVAPTMMEIE